MIRTLSLLATALLAAPSAPCAESQAPTPGLPETVGPYLQNPAPDAMTVCYLTAGPGEVTLTRDGSDAPVPCAGTALEGTPWTVWKTRLTGLQPGAECRYRVVWTHDGSVRAESPAAAFRTPDHRADEARFIVVNDVHDRQATLEALMAHVQPSDFGFSVLLGDCWNDPGAQNGAERVILTLDSFVRTLAAASRPMLFVRGNHETRGSFSARLAHLFDLPGLRASDEPDQRCWWFTQRTGPLFLVAADTGEDDGFTTPADSYKRPAFWQEYRRRQAAWLADLADRNAPGDSTWRIFVSHIPLYNPAGWNSEPSRVFWEPELRRLRPDLMLAGHDHSWRFVPADAPFVRATKAADGTRKEETLTPPWPIVIGGGPAIAQGTVAVVAAGRDRLSVRLLDAGGRVLHHYQSDRRHSDR